MTTHSVEDRNGKLETMEELNLQKLTEEELTKLKHALGFDNKEPKGGVFEAYRRCSLNVPRRHLPLGGGGIGTTSHCKYTNNITNKQTFFQKKLPIIYTFLIYTDIYI